MKATVSIVDKSCAQDHNRRLLLAYLRLLLSLMIL
jgi:hypothetical protein